MIQSVCSILIILLALHPSAPSGDTDDCRQKLKTYSASVSMKELPGAKQLYYIHYQVFTQMRSEKNPDTRTEVKAMLGSAGMFYESDVISMYKDAEEIYTVVHPQKKIVRSIADNKTDMNLRRQQASLLQDSLIDNSLIRPCQKGIYHGKNVTRIELAPNASVVKKTAIEKIIYYYNEEKQTMEGQEIFYSKASPMVKREIRFLSLDFNYKGKVKPKAREYLFEGEKLKPAFRGYTFEDNTRE